MLFKKTYTSKELDEQMNYLDNKCKHCLHKCREFSCRAQDITAKVAERTPDITAEQKQRYFSLVGA